MLKKYLESHIMYSTGCQTNIFWNDGAEDQEINFSLDHSEKICMNYKNLYNFVNILHHNKPRVYFTCLSAFVNDYYFRCKFSL